MSGGAVVTRAYVHVMALDREKAKAFLLETETYVDTLGMGLREGLSEGPTIGEFMSWSLTTTARLANLVRIMIDELPDEVPDDVG